VANNLEWQIIPETPPETYRQLEFGCLPYHRAQYHDVVEWRLRSLGVSNYPDGRNAVNLGPTFFTEVLTSVPAAAARIL
jgi:hypothetical protein